MVRINLLPVRVSKKKAAGKQQLLLFALVVVIGVIGNFTWVSGRSRELKNREANASRTRAEIAQLDRIIGEVKNIKTHQSALREKLDVLAELKAGRTGPVRMLDELATVTPKRLWISKLEEKKGSITLAGAAISIDDVSEFMTALRGSTQFANVELKKTAAKVDKANRIVDFVLTAGVKYAKPPPDPKAAAPRPGAKAAAPAAAPAAKGGH
jgi:type IV pilus assembly protein PilN